MSNKKNNVVQFPIVNPDLYTKEALQQSKLESKALLENVFDHIVDISLEMSMGLFNEIETRLPYHDPMDPDMQKDFVLIHEAIKSAIARRYGLKHEMQGFAEKSIDITKSDIQWIPELD
tara:strand:- start:348 stop:704 length:357 start_codon:yes stop_codon:yes gene_type:complete